MTATLGIHGIGFTDPGLKTPLWQYSTAIPLIKTTVSMDSIRYTLGGHYQWNSIKGASSACVES